MSWWPYVSGQERCQGPAHGSHDQPVFSMVPMLGEPRSEEKVVQ